MKPSKLLRSNDTRGMLIACTDQWVDTEQTYDVLINLTCMHTVQRGVLEYKATAFEARGDGQLVSIASITRLYPNAQVESYEAHLYTLQVRLARLLEDRREDTRREGRSV